MPSNNLIIVTGHHHSGTTIIGSHIASCKGCSLIWEPLNPTTNNYRFDYTIDKWFYNPKLHTCDINRFYNALDRAIHFKLTPFNLRDISRPKNSCRFLKQFIQVSLASFYQYRPVVKDPISFLSTEIYKKYNPKIVVTLKKPLSYIYSEFSRCNLPPWDSLRPYFDNYDYSPHIYQLLHKAYQGYLSLEAQQALFWFCSIKCFGLARLMNNDCYFIRSDEYLKSPDKIMSDLCLFLGLEPSRSTKKLVLNNHLGFLDTVDSYLRNYNFSKYTGLSASRSAKTIDTFLPSDDCIEILEKFCNPLALQLGWSNLSLSI